MRVGMMKYGPIVVAALLALSSCVTTGRYSEKEIELYDRAYALYSVGNYGEATVVLDRLLSINAKNEYAYRLRSMILWVTDKPESAIQDLESARKIDPRSAIIAYNLGCVYESVGDLDKAIDSYSSAVRIDPQYAYAWLNRANAYMKKGDAKAALADYRKFIQLSSEQRKDVQSLIDKLEGGA